MLRFACKTSLCQFLATPFFTIPLIANRFRPFLRRYVNLARCSALGFFYEALFSKYFHSGFTGKKGLCVDIANCDYISGIVVGMLIFTYALFFINSLITNRFSSFFATICKFSTMFWLGFYYEALLQIFSSVFTVEKSCVWILRNLISKVALWTACQFLC